MEHLETNHRSSFHLRAQRALGGSALVGALLVGAGLSTPSAHAATTHSGPVAVLYAGSLLDVMQQKIDPAFHQATGYDVVGVSNGSSALATEIKGGTEVGDVFLSASPKADATLAGAKNGSWVSSYREFATSQLVLGYNPASKFAAKLRHEPWFDVVDLPGFVLGRTDPATDPKGVLAVDALQGVALSYGVPQLANLATSKTNVFSETSLVGELQAGQLDAGFFYKVEASAAHLRTVPLVATNLHATYTLAELKNAPHSTAAQAFIAFLLSPRGRTLLKADGVTPMVPATTVTP
jgi:molybdate/tungstate transport system substrate-binding protein